MVKEDAIARKAEAAAVGAAVEMGMMGVVVVVVEVVKEAKVGVEEENQEAMVENPPVEEATQWKCSKLVRKPCLIPVAACLLHKSHQSTMSSHPSGVQKHLPFQARHQRPPRCNAACHLE